MSPHRWTWISRGAQLALLACACVLAFGHGESSGGFRVLTFDFARNLGGQLACALVIVQCAVVVLLRRHGRAPVAMTALWGTLPAWGMVYLGMVVRLGALQVPDRGPHSLLVFGVVLAFAASGWRSSAPRLG